MDKDIDKAVELIRRLLKGRVDSFEVFLSSSKGLSVEAKDGKVDALRVTSSRGASIRTIKDGRPGFSFSNVFTEEALKDMADLALSGSLGATVDGYLAFPSPCPPLTAEPLGTVDGAWGKAKDEEKIARAVSMEEEALGFDPRIKRVRKATYGETYVSSRTVNSNGVDADYAGTFFSGSVLAIAEEGKESEMGWDIGMGHGSKDVDCFSIAKGAALKAVEMLGAKPIKTLKCPCVFENTVVVEFIEVLSASFLADSVLKGKSMLAAKVGKKVAASCLNLFDDGLMRGGWASSLYDTEGAPKKKTCLLKEGVCEGFLYDTYWAKRAGKDSTGNAVRGGFKSTPSPGISNLHIERGEKSFDEILKRMDKGLLIKEVMGLHTIDPVSGEFSLGASGLWVEGGKPVYPVRGIAIAGSLLELFSKVEEVGSDVRFIGSVGAPSLLFSEINISGI